MEINITDYIRDVPDFPKKGIIFKDISPLLENPKAFQESIQQLCENIWDANHIVGLDARWFIFWAAVAHKLWLPFSMVRKVWKLPYTCYSQSYSLEYWENTFEIHTDSLSKNSRVAVIDDLLATWGSIQAACKLAEKTWAKVTSCHFVIELQFLEGRSVLNDIPYFSLLKF